LLVGKAFFCARAESSARLAIPLALEARWTSAAWAVEGAAVLWAGIRQRRLLARLFGLLLQFGAAIAFLIEAQHGVSGTWPVLNSNGLGMLKSPWRRSSRHCSYNAATTSLRDAERICRPLFSPRVPVVLALGIVEIDHHVRDPWLPTAGLLFLAGSAIAFTVASRAGWNGRSRAGRHCCCCRS